MGATVEQFLLLSKKGKNQKTFRQAKILILLQLVLFNLAFSQTKSLVEISGQVTDQEKNQPLPDVSVQVKGTVSGTVTNSTGYFVLRTKVRLPFTLVFSSVGFKQQELEVKKQAPIFR